MTGKLFRTISVCATLALLLGGSAFARQADRGRQGKSSSSTELTQQEQDFINNAAAADLAEIQLGSLVQRTSQETRVQEYGRMLAADHEQNLEQLQSLAARYNFQMSTSIDGAHQQALNQLKALSGLQLDRKFASQEIADHQKTIQEFQKMAKGAPTPEVKLYATQTLPVLQKHLEEARELQSTIPSSSSGKQQ